METKLEAKRRFEAARQARLQKLADTYSDLARYWMGQRMIGSWQTVEFIGNQAAHCTTQAVRFARLAG